MPKRQAEWAAIVKKYNLVAPVDLHAYVGESFFFADSCLGYRKDGSPKLVSQPMLVSTIKARQAGFHDCIDSGGHDAQVDSRFSAEPAAAADQLGAASNAFAAEVPAILPNTAPDISPVPPG